MLYNVTVYYEDGSQFNFDKVNRIGFYHEGQYIELTDDKIKNHAFDLHRPYYLYSETGCVTISDKQLRCIEIFEG